MPHRLKDPDLLAVHASDDSLHSHHSHAALHAGSMPPHLLTKPVGDVTIQQQEAAQIAAHAPPATDPCVTFDASPSAVNAKRCLEDVHQAKSPLRSDSTAETGNSSATHHIEQDTHADSEEHDGVDGVDDDDEDDDDDEYEQSGGKAHSASSKDSTPHSGGSTSADSTPQMVFRRHRRRPRRSTAELEMYERWTCPKNCGKVYRKNSTVSIRKHLPHCTGPPVYMPPQVHSYSMMQPHMPHHPYEMHHYDPNMPPPYHMDYSQQQGCGLPYAPSLPQHMHHRTMHQPPPQHTQHPAHQSMYSMDPSQVPQSYASPYGHPQYNQTPYSQQTPYPTMQQQQYPGHPMMPTQQMSMTMQPQTSQLPGAYPGNPYAPPPPSAQMMPGLATPPTPSRLPVPTLPPIMPHSSQLPAPAIAQPSPSPVATAGVSSPLTAATALAALMRAPEAKVAPAAAPISSAFSRVIPRQ